MDKQTKATVTETAYKAAYDILRGATPLLLEAGIAAGNGKVNEALGGAVCVEADLEKALNLIRAANTIAAL